MVVTVRSKHGEVSMPWWAWSVVALVLVTLLGGAAGSANRVFTRVADHETRITVNERAIDRQRDDLQEIKATTQEILRELRRR